MNLLIKNEGVEYLFNYSYHPNAIELTNDLAIKFLVTDELLSNDVSQLPSLYNIKTAYPNPFNPSVSIELSLYAADNVELSIVDLSGRVVSKLYSGLLMTGEHVFEWTPDVQISSGVYFVNMNIPNKGIIDSKQITLIK